MEKRPKTGGRKKGTPNKVSWPLREMAGHYTESALSVLADIMRHGTSETARVAAANALLDRGHGRPAQALTGADGGSLGVVLQIVTGVDRMDEAA